MTDRPTVSDPASGILFDPREGLAFAGSGLDRAVGVRADPGALVRLAGMAGTRILPLWRGRALLSPGGTDPVIGAGLAALRPGAPLLDFAQGPPLFLGLSGGQAVFMQDVSPWEPEGEGDPVPPGAPPGVAFGELRGALLQMDARAGELMAIGRALLQWHEGHGFCGKCGAPTRATLGGWQRHCPACDTHHFPRTDPVVIMRVTRGNAVLMGRSPGWPEGMYSCLAGFVEPGETVEAAVRREVAEETAIRVGAVRMLASQPWPFPMQLMLACEGEALSAEITLDPVELEDALWVGRERLAGIFAGTDPVIRAPRAGAIAGWMLRGWLADRDG
ncbi:NAD(+) diphosphatase [Paenirhodobacter sp.]|uniref:NAD(+) diphosphatase n=1 Tax=Paenirhodobacter sp. TaxID=1965326 RepID=UPI003B422D8F